MKEPELKEHLHYVSLGVKTLEINSEETEIVRYMLSESFYRFLFDMLAAVKRDQAIK
jgi:hypothetical protein